MLGAGTSDACIRRQCVHNASKVATAPYIMSHPVIQHTHTVHHVCCSPPQGMQQMAEWAQQVSSLSRELGVYKNEAAHKHDAWVRATELLQVCASACFVACCSVAVCFEPLRGLVGCGARDSRLAADVCACIECACNVSLSCGVCRHAVPRLEQLVS